MFLKSDKPFDPVLTFPPAVIDFVTAEYERASTILEYGSGGSTALAVRLGKRVISVESDANWARQMQTYLDKTSPATSAVVYHVDIGPTGKWGFPTDNTKMASYSRYPLSVWDLPDFQTPDLILIDGRFRVACLVTALMKIDRPTRVLFDDYAERKSYHVIEKLIRPTQLVERMAAFDLVPGLDLAKHLSWMIKSFTTPR